MDNEKIKLSKLKNIAMDLRNSIEDSTKLLSNDLTNEFFDELEIMIAKGEIIIIHINGKMRLGKSAVGMAIADYIYELLIKYKYQNKNTQFGIKNIARDQNEKLQYMLNPKNQHTVLLTDEFNEMEDSGLNTTANQRLLNDFSNIQAGRYVHGINISPTGITDNNTDIVLNVIEKREHKKECVCELKYRDYVMGNMIEIMIGTVIIHVGHIIETWENKVKQHFYKASPTKNDKIMINKYAKEDWYTQYVIRKFQRMDLVNKEGIMRPRELQWVKLQWEIITKFKDYTKFMKVTNGQLIKAMVKPYLIKNKIPVSILGIKELAEDVMGILKIYEEYYKNINDVNDLKFKFESSKDFMKKQQIQEIIQGKEEGIELLRESIQENTEHFEKMLKIKEKYDKIDEKWS